MFRTTRLTCCITVAWILTSFIARGATANPFAESAFDLEPNIVWRGDEPFERSTFRWLLPSTGIATVDLQATGSNQARIARLAVIRGEQAAKVHILKRSANQLVLAVRSAGELYLATDTEASEFRLVTSFTQTEVIDEAFELGSTGRVAVQTSFLVAGPANKAEPEVFPPDPDGLVAAGSHLVASILTLERAAMLKAEPEVFPPDPDGLVAAGCHLDASFVALEQAAMLKAEPEVFPPDPDGLPTSDVSRSSPALRQVLHFEPICRRTEFDDHGDTTSCATPLTLGRSVTGELANDWNDDRDVFSFHLAKVSKLEIVLATEVAGFTYELSDSAGQRLVVDRLRTNDETELHLVSTLAPGRYFFRVNGASGAYALTTMASN